jgi:hypothetical protein
MKLPLVHSKGPELTTLGVGIANGGGTISDMFDPSERA